MRRYTWMLFIALLVGSTTACAGCGKPNTTPSLDLKLASCTVATLARPDVGDGFITWDSVVIDPTGRYLAGTLSNVGPHRRISFLQDLRTGHIRVIRTDGLVEAVNASGVLVAAGLPAWTYRDGHVTLLPTYLGQDMFPRGINARGDIVGSVEPDAGGFTAALWPADHPAMVEALLPHATNGAIAYAVTDAGIIAGESDTMPFVWTDPGVAGHPLPTGVSDQLGAITAASGRYAVGYVYHPDDYAQHAVSWDLSTGRPTAYPTGYELRGISATGTAIGDLRQPNHPYTTTIGVLIRHGAIERLPGPDVTADIPDNVRLPSPDPSAVLADPNAAIPTGITADGTTVVGTSVAAFAGYSISAAIWHC